MFVPRMLVSRAAVATSRPFASAAIDAASTLHHGQRPRYREKPKFKSPRKRASNLLHELQTEAIEQSKNAKPEVWGTKFSPGDAIEIQWGRSADESEKLRGVVLGIYRKKMDESVLIRDVVFGQPVERRIPLHSPLVQSVKVLEENFIYKGKRKVKRAKLYFLRDRNPNGKLWPPCWLGLFTVQFSLV